jgi:hypothetical protein
MEVWAGGRDDAPTSEYMGQKTQTNIPAINFIALLRRMQKVNIVPPHLPQHPIQAIASAQTSSSLCPPLTDAALVFEPQLQLTSLGYVTTLPKGSFKRVICFSLPPNCSLIRSSTHEAAGGVGPAIFWIPVDGRKGGGQREPLRK